MSTLFAFLLSGNREIRMPVTPARYSWGAGKTVHTVGTVGVGDVFLAGLPQPHSDRVDFLLPARPYPFMQAGTVADPMVYISAFSALAREKTPVRYIVGDRVNAEVLIEDMTYEEKDGTGDIYMTLYLKEHRALRAVRHTESGTVNPDTGNKRRPAPEGGGQTYTVQRGDCLSVLCRRFYGDGSAKIYNAVARANGIRNPNLIYAGQTVRFPPRAALEV